MTKEMKWYVIQTTTNREKSVKQTLEREIIRVKAESLIPQIIIPMEKVFFVKNGKKTARERNFFPGYLLIEAVINGDLIDMIKKTPNVLGFLGSKDTPNPLRKTEVERILGRMISEVEEVDSAFMVGELVKVIDGPFTSMSGVISNINEEKKKINVLIKIFGRDVTVDILSHQIDRNII